MAGRAVVGSLRVDLGMDTAEFAKGAKDAETRLGRLLGTIKSFAAGAVAALSTAAIASAIRSSVNHMDKMGDAAQRVGIAVEELSKLEYAARFADVSLGDLEANLTKFNRSLAQIQAGGSNDASVALRALGVAATDSSGKLRPVPAIMADLAEEFAGMEDGAGKAAIAVALFGKSGTAMIPMLNEGREGLAGAAAQAEKLGLVISSNTSAAAAQFNDNLDILTYAAQGLTQQIAEKLLPTMVAITNSMVDYIGEGDVAEQISKALGFVMKELARFAVDVATAFEELTIWIGAVKDTLFTSVTDIGRIKDIWVKAADDVGNAWAENAERVADMQEAVANATVIKTTDRKKYAAPVLPAPGGSGGNGKPGQNTYGIYGTPFLKFVPDDIQKIDDALEGLSTTSRTIGEEIGDNLGGAFRTWIDDALDGTFNLSDALGSLAKQFLNMTLSNAATNLFKNTGHGLYGGAGGGFLASLLNSFSGFFAGGGKIASGRWGIAGEAGPELIAGPATVTPMGGGGSTIIINNAPPGTTARETVDSRGNRRVEVQVAEMIAAEQMRPGSAAARARGASPYVTR